MRSIPKITIEIDRPLEGSVLEAFTLETARYVEKECEQKLQQIISKAVERKVNEFCDKTVEAKIEEFFTKPQPRTNSWGEKTGATQTLRDVFLERFKSWLDERVDSEGRVSTYGSNPLRSQWLLDKVATKPLRDAIDKTVSEISAKAREHIQASVSRYIAEKLTPTINVPPLGKAELTI